MPKLATKHMQVAPQSLKVGVRYWIEDATSPAGGYYREYSGFFDGYEFGGGSPITLTESEIREMVFTSAPPDRVKA